jgi:hypothetical protein
MYDKPFVVFELVGLYCKSPMISVFPAVFWCGTEFDYDTVTSANKGHSLPFKARMQE